jgi:hypothetical protein
MYRVIAWFLFFVSASSLWAGTIDSGYNVAVHVISSRLIVEAQCIGRSQLLAVTINGKNYELESGCGFAALFALGDYKAKLVKDEHKSAYDALQVYEILLPDNKTRKFEVVGQSE